MTPDTLWATLWRLKALSLVVMVGALGAVLYRHPVAIRFDPDAKLGDDHRPE